MKQQMFMIYFALFCIFGGLNLVACETEIRFINCTDAACKAACKKAVCGATRCVSGLCVRKRVFEKSVCVCAP